MHASTTRFRLGMGWSAPERAGPAMTEDPSKADHLRFLVSGGIMTNVRASSSDGQSACLTYTRSGVQVPSRPPYQQFAVAAREVRDHGLFCERIWHPGPPEGGLTRKNGESRMRIGLPPTRRAGSCPSHERDACPVHGRVHGISSS
jgi:hypothetical protein